MQFWAWHGGHGSQTGTYSRVQGKSWWQEVPRWQEVRRCQLVPLRGSVPSTHDMPDLEGNWRYGSNSIFHWLVPYLYMEHTDTPARTPESAILPGLGKTRLHFSPSGVHQLRGPVCGAQVHDPSVNTSEFPSICTHPLDILGLSRGCQWSQCWVKHGGWLVGHQQLPPVTQRTPPLKTAVW